MRDTVTVAEAAAITGVSADTVKRRIKSGELRAVKVGKTLRINRADLGVQRAPADLQDLISGAFQNVADQLHLLALRIEQREQATATLEKSVTALVTKAAN